MTQNGCQTRDFSVLVFVFDILLSIFTWIITNYLITIYSFTVQFSAQFNYWTMDNQIDVHTLHSGSAHLKTFWGGRQLQKWIIVLVKYHGTLNIKQALRTVIRSCSFKFKVGNANQDKVYSKDFKTKLSVQRDIWWIGLWYVVKRELRESRF